MSPILWNLCLHFVLLHTLWSIAPNVTLIAGAAITMGMALIMYSWTLAVILAVMSSFKSCKRNVFSAQLCVGVYGLLNFLYTYWNWVPLYFNSLEVVWVIVIDRKSCTSCHRRGHYKIESVYTWKCASYMKQRLTLYFYGKCRAIRTFHRITTAPGSDCDVILLAMEECEGQLSWLEESIACSNDSTDWQGNGRINFHNVATDVGIVGVRNVPHHRHWGECLVESRDPFQGRQWSIRRTWWTYK